MKSRCGFSLLFCFICPCLAHAATYQWVDENGVTHFSQTLPPKAEYKVIQDKQRYPSNPAKQQTNEAPPPEPQPEKSAEAEQSSSETQPLSKEECDQIKLDLEKLRSIPRIRLQQGDSTKLLTDEEKQTMIDERTQWLESYCK